MYEIVEKKKEELRIKSEKYKEDLIDVYSGSPDDTGSFFRLGLAGGGFILNLLFPDTNSETGNKKNNYSNGIFLSHDGEFRHQDPEWQSKAEFKENLIIVLLEISRQILLLLTEKLVPANDNGDIR